MNFKTFRSSLIAAIQLLFEIAKRLSLIVLVFGVVPYAIYWLTGLPMWVSAIFTLLAIVLGVLLHVVFLVACFFQALSTLDDVPYDEDID